MEKSRINNATTLVALMFALMSCKDTARKADNIWLELKDGGILNELSDVKSFQISYNDRYLSIYNMRDYYSIDGTVSEDLVQFNENEASGYVGYVFGSIDSLVVEFGGFGQEDSLLCAEIYRRIYENKQICNYIGR